MPPPNLKISAIDSRGHEIHGEILSGGRYEIGLFFGQTYQLVACSLTRDLVEVIPDKKIDKLEPIDFFLTSSNELVVSQERAQVHAPIKRKSKRVPRTSVQVRFYAAACLVAKTVATGSAAGNELGSFTLKVPIALRNTITLELGERETKPEDVRLQSGFEHEGTIELEVEKQRLVAQVSLRPTKPLPSPTERRSAAGGDQSQGGLGGGLGGGSPADTNGPGVTTGAGGAGSVGQSAQGLQITVDGGAANDTLVNQSTATVNVNTTQGIEISQGDYQTVETGGSAGNKIFVFTKRGTNAFHGSVAYWGRNDALDARNFFNLPDFKTLRNHDGSAQLGGPLWKDKAFFFGSYELIRGVQAPTFSPVLTSQLSALNQALLRLDLPAENLRRFVTDHWSDSPLIRIDYQPNDKHTLWWRYGFEGTGWRKDFVGGINAPSSARDLSGRNHLFGFRHEWSVSQSFRVETGYSYLHDSATLAPVEANQVSLLIPGVALLGRTMSLLEGDGYRQRHHLISENVTIAPGRHTLRFGGLFGRDQNLFHFATFQSGRAIVPGLTALSAIPPRADLFQIGAGGSEVSFSVSSLEFYAQDDFRLTPRVTLNFGLRYKAELPPSFQVKDTNGWQPRIGLAWVRDQNSKTVVRMGYGVYRGYIPQLPIGFGLLQGAGFQSGAPPPVRRVSSYVGNLAASNALNQFLTTGSTPPGPQLATFSDRTSTGSLTQNASLTVQRQLTSRLTLEVSYLYSRGDHLLTSTNVNLPPPTIVNGRPDFGNGALNPNFAQVYEFQTVGKSLYHSGTAGTRMPSYKGLTLSAYYAFSRSIDDVPLGSYEATPENVFDRRSERSVSDFNLAHNFSLSTAWKVPQPHSKTFEWARSWFGRPEISGVLLLRSGSYFNVLAGSDANHDGNPLTDRPLGVSRNTFLGPKFAQLDIQAASRYFVLKEVKEGVEMGWTVDFFNLLNRANFTNINTVLGQTDLTGVDPRIVFGRNGIPSFDFRSPLTPSGFGLATSAATPRRIQFGLKLSF